MAYSLSDQHEYQSKAIIDLSVVTHGALFAGLGLGKTVMGMDIAKSRQDLGKDKGKILVIAPLKVALNGWHTEAGNWEHLSGLKFSIACGGTGPKQLAALKADADVYVINYENIVWMINTFYKNDWKWDHLIIDESSMIKNATSKRSKYLRSICQKRIYMITRGPNKGKRRVHQPKVKSVLLLSATPATRGLENLWSQIFVLDGGERLGRTMDLYLAKYFYPVHRPGSPYIKWKLRPGAKSEIFEAIADIAYVLRTEDHLDMPDLIRKDYVVRLPPKARRQYDELEKEFVLELENENYEIDEVYAANEAALGNKLLQFCNGAVYIGDPQDPNYKKEWREVHTEKLDALEEIYEANKISGENMLVCYWFKSDLERLLKRFPNAKVMDRQGKLMKDWNDGKIDMLFIHPASSGLGLNLQLGGRILVFFSLTWVLEYVLQIIGRIYRQGQKGAVTVINIVVENSKEQRVSEVLADNNRTQDELLAYLKR